MRLYDEIIHSEGWTAFAGARVLFMPLRAAYFEGVNISFRRPPDKKGGFRRVV